MRIYDEGRRRRKRRRIESAKWWQTLTHISVFQLHFSFFIHIHLIITLTSPVSRTMFFTLISPHHHIFVFQLHCTLIFCFVPLIFYISSSPFSFSINLKPTFEVCFSINFSSVSSNITSIFSYSS